MSRYVPLSKKHHLQAGVLPLGHAHAVQQSTVPLVLEELPQVLPHMVAAFTLAQGGGYQLVALQSLAVNNNVYLDAQGRWLEGYQPAWYRSHPFRVVSSSQGSHFLVYVDEDSAAFESPASANAMPLFDEQGEYTDGTQRVVGFLQQLHKSTRLTTLVLGQLDAAGLIAAWAPQWTVDAPAPGQPLEQLYHIDEQKLRALPAEQLAGLARSGALSVAYAQLLSEHRLAHLTRLCETRWAQSPPAAEASGEDLFGGDDDVLRFDF